MIDSRGRGAEDEDGDDGYARLLIRANLDNIMYALTESGTGYGSASVAAAEFDGRVFVSCLVLSQRAHGKAKEMEVGRAAPCPPSRGPACESGVAKRRARQRCDHHQHTTPAKPRCLAVHACPSAHTRPPPPRSAAPARRGATRC